ncbi:dihydrolipoyl dehydrogenase [Salinicoccus sp. HZC-1]|uniref:dihydrolipoyl dehydrogenase n=1 Tax=Salinicoccus sp. HZC-1 TaxID=3385497 RepID=UPI00398B9A38
MAHEYDLVVLGGGTAGYVAAIKASQLGLKTAIVEKSNLGGTCLHKGCIPTKSMLKSAEVVNTMKNAEKYGIESFNPSISMEKILNRKNEVVERMHSGIKQLMKKNKIDVFDGYGRILGPSIFSPMAGTVAVENPEDDEAESEILVNHNVLIATGSYPRPLPFLPFDGEIVLSSDDMMTLNEIPEKLAIIGGGVIGLEFASLLADLGSGVTVIEAGNQVLPAEDKDVANHLKKSLEEKGIEFKVDISLSDESVQKSGSSITFDIGGESTTFDKVLVSIGRTPNVEDIGLSNTKIQMEKGFIVTDEYYQTKDKNIYAVGDVIGNLQLAHVATKEALIAVEHITDNNPLPLDYRTVPKCIYTSPETASVGYTEKELKEEGREYKVHKVPLAAIGKAVIAGGEKGFGKLIVDPATKDILGVSIIGPGATELINEAAFAKFLDASSLELGMSVHAHPSIGEVLMELGLDADGIAIHV